MQRYKRDASPNEKLYMDYERLYTTLDIQMVIEGDGTLDRNLFQLAIKEASKICPAARCILTPEMQWVDKGESPPIYYIGKQGALVWNLNSLEFLKTKIDYTTYPVAEIYVIEGEPYRILFRIFHGAMDGKGALKWIDNIFRAMNNRKLIPALETYNDVDYLKTLNYYKSAVPFQLKYAVFPQNKQGNLDVYWKHITIQGQHKQVLPKVAKYLTAYFDGESQKFLVPVDIRRHKPVNACTANLTLPIFLDVDKQMTQADINKQLLKHLKNNKELNLWSAQLNYMDKLPRPFKDVMIKSIVKLQQLTGRFAISGILSHLGKINLENYSTSSFKANKFYSLPIQQPFSPLALVAAQTNNALELSFSSSTRYIKQEEMDQLLEHVQQAFSYEEEVIKLVGEEKPDVFDFLSHWNKQVLLHHDVQAVKADDISLTYHELNERCEALANYLTQQGAKPQDELIIYMNKSIDFVVSVLACIQYGFIYCPLDIALPNARLKQMIEHIKPKFILTQSKHIINLQEISSLNIVKVDCIESHHNQNKPKCKRKRCFDKVYKIFTSGSSDIPKAVEITYEGLCNYLGWATQYYQIGKPFVCPIITSLGVDLTITSLFLPLLTGGAVKISKEQLDGANLESILKDTHINAIKLTPTHLKMIEQLDLKVNGKEILIVGGENFSTVLAKQTQKRFGYTCRIFNEYGPTEATVGCTVHEYQEHLDATYKSVPIGKPIYNTNIMIEQGNLFVGGKGLAWGYDDLEMTQTKFRYIDKIRMYDTGDLVYLNDKQQLMYCSRSDRQVKIYGNRIELGEIEACLCNYKKGVQSAVVYVQEKNQLRAYVVGITKEEIPLLKKRVSEQLPVYMIPSTITIIKDIPCTLSGKLDEKYLATFSNHRLYINLENTSIISNLTPIQKRVKEIWMACLEKEELDINLEDDFYDLGGDSLSILTMNTQIARRFDTEEKRNLYEEQVEKIYENFTLRSMITLIESIGGWNES